ncbi:Protein of unknown function [Alkalispirochaeta americana]|uniref:DUF3798 domain-containing protein n=1 Tax=Alkalispirochaeta americana TaxID=159291 RepID=A0A1N6WV64_9SPIO|nr:DUF3798 domain-containing protein [Alkalispirochaeta americana]SIQ94007.1 Protein of unknown function [Alkalispirochaeta americana]
MKRIFGFMVLAALATSTVFAGGRQEASADAWKIGILTGTVTQNEEEYRMAEQMQQEFGAEHIEIRTYPDRFMQEQETTISQMMALASDPAMKAIVMVQAVPGTAAAVDRVREVRPDILIILGAPQEDPDLIARRGDIVFDTNNIGRGYQIAEHANNMGAETLVHYSFPRHMSIEFLAQRRDLMKERAEQLGMRFVEVDAPDPTGDAGVPGTQQFINEDVSRQVARLGKDTAFFGTNCSMMEPLIRQTVSNKAIFPVQCCPSPYHAMPGALGISVPSDKQGNLEWIMGEIGNAVAEADMQGRVATWPAPINMAMIQAGTYYAVDYIQGRTSGKVDDAAMRQKFIEITGGADLSTYGDHSNFYLVLLDHHIF